MFAVAAYRLLSGQQLLAPTAGLPIYPEHSYVGIAVIFGDAGIRLRLYSPNRRRSDQQRRTRLQKPKAKNAAETLAIWAFSRSPCSSASRCLRSPLMSMWPTAPPTSDCPPTHPPKPRSLRSPKVFGAVPSSITTGRHGRDLILAANTAFNGFPLLASLLATDRFMPRQLHNRGDRLVYSNGIILLALFAIALIVAFQANVSSIIQLYIIGVFVSFTLSQLGMVRHWQRELTAARRVAPERGSVAPKRSTPSGPP